jgi:hypothetical protein
MRGGLGSKQLRPLMMLRYLRRKQTQEGYRLAVRNEVERLIYCDTVTSSCVYITHLA